MQVIYIASPSHSGSTLLNLMLGAHPEIVAVGELHKLNRRSVSVCGCGASIWDCEFWSGVSKETLQTLGKSIADLDILNYTEMDEAHSPNAVAFRAISQVSGKRYVVDSSKRPGRLSYLTQLESLDVFPIHLTRNPKGQICSAIRQNGGFAEHIYNYVVIHERIRRVLKSVPHRVVHYEDLVLDPKRTLNTILEPLGLKFHRRQLAWETQLHHMIAGNKLQWQPSGLILDERWKYNLSHFQQFAISLGTAYSRRRLGSSV